MWVGLMLLSMGLVLASLVAGLWTFTRGSQEASEKAQALMRWRVLFQGIALLLFLMALRPS